MKKEKIDQNTNSPDKIPAKAVKSRGLGFVAKVVAVNLINLVLLGAIFYFLSTLPATAQKIKELKSTQLLAQETSDAAVIRSDISKNQDKIDRLKALFKDENGVGDFLNALTQIQSEGVLNEVSFPGAQSSDRGQPLQILLVFSGSEEAVNSALLKVYDLPVLLTPQNVEISGNAEALTIRFAVTIQTNENFSKN